MEQRKNATTNTRPYITPNTFSTLWFITFTINFSNFMERKFWVTFLGLFIHFCIKISENAHSRFLVVNGEEHRGCLHYGILIMLLIIIVRIPVENFCTSTIYFNNTKTASHISFDICLFFINEPTILLDLTVSDGRKVGFRLSQPS